MSRTVLVSSCMMLMAALLLGQAQPSSSTMPAREFVRRVIEHKRNAEAEDHSHWRCVVYHEEAGKMETREVIETAHGDMICGASSKPANPRAGRPTQEGRFEGDTCCDGFSDLAHDRKWKALMIQPFMKGGKIVSVSTRIRLWRTPTPSCYSVRRAPAKVRKPGASPSATAFR